MAMVDLALYFSKTPSSKALSLTVIAERQELPLPYLEQLFSKLRRADLVKSMRGSFGGYELARPASHITMADIVQAVDVPMKATRCSGGGKGCQSNGNQCLTHDLWDELSAVVHGFLSQVTLEDVCKKNIKGRGRFAILPVFSTPSDTGPSNHASITEKSTDDASGGCFYA
jgi:Rrf2 family iron-sulfur cluster assembly transcriptional regulator